jgi:hypothetical protein
MKPEKRGRLEELRHEYLWRRYALDQQLFFRREWWITTPEHGPQLFILRPAQQFGLNHWDENRYSLTLKARQIGWTTLVAAHCFHDAYFGDAKEILFLSRGEREAKNIKRKVDFGFKRLPDWLKQRGPKVVSDTQEVLEFDNGSVLKSLPSASDPARSLTASKVVIDEWAFLTNPEEAWASIEPVTDIGGRIIGLSTANGIGNFFYELWIGAEQGENPFVTMFQPWWANGDRDAAWYEDKRRSMNEWQLAQEYPNTPEEAFIKSGRPFFDLSALERQADHIVEPIEGVLV